MGELDASLLNDRFAKAWKARPEFDYTFEGWNAIVDETFAGLAGDKPIPCFFPELYERFGRADAWQIFADVLPAIERLLQRGIRTGIISNWDARLRPLLVSLGLAERFETIIISCEVGCVKPVRQIFEVASRQLGVEPAAILHVGDSLTADVEGARGAGFRAVLLSRGRTVTKAGAISSLRDLPIEVD